MYKWGKSLILAILAALMLGLVPVASASAAGCGTLRIGARGDCVRQLQQELISGGYSTRATGNFQQQTLSAVKKFQSDHGLAADGVVGSRTWAKLQGSTTSGSPLSGVDARTLTAAKAKGVAIDVNKSDRQLRVVQYKNGAYSIIGQGNARFGDKRGPESATKEGAFKTFRKGGANYVSSTYNASMPYPTFFYKGQAVHYSPTFAQHGYNGASHGCINLDKIELARQVNGLSLGVTIVVHR